MNDLNYPNPLFHEGWMEFNRQKWSITPERLKFSPEGKTKWELDVVIYQTKTGRICKPPLNAYLPLHFKTSGNLPGIRARRWREASSKLVACLNNNKTRGLVALPPEITDVRELIWSGWIARPRYTYYLNPIQAIESANPEVKNKIRKGHRNGFYCSVTTDFDNVYACLTLPEKRKGFKHRITAADLHHLYELMGPDNFVCFGCYSPEGKMVGAWVRIYHPGGIAIALMAGMQTKALKAGAQAVLTEYALNYFAQAGCKVFDFAGGNLSTVATMKEAWGGRLKTYYEITARDLRYLAREHLEWIKTRIGRKR